MGADQPPDEPGRSLTADEGGGPPVGSAWTLVIEGDEAWEADLEHAAPVPRVGETVEFIGEGGRRREYRVRAVIHTVQPSASERPLVAAERSSPNSILTEGGTDEPPRSLRAGLPRVVVVPLEG